MRVCSSGSRRFICQWRIIVWGNRCLLQSPRARTALLVMLLIVHCHCPRLQLCNRCYSPKCELPSPAALKSVTSLLPVASALPVVLPLSAKQMSPVMNPPTLSQKSSFFPKKQAPISLAWLSLLPRLCCPPLACSLSYRYVEVCCYCYLLRC